MKIIIFIAILLPFVTAHAATRKDVEAALGVYQERCMYGAAFLKPLKRKSFVSFHTVECRYYSVSLTVSRYLDAGYDSDNAKLVLSRNHNNKTLSSLLKRPPAVSLYKRYRSITRGKKKDYLDTESYQKLMRYIYKKRFPYSILTTEDLKHINKKQGLVITQFVEIHFNKLDDAFDFVTQVAEKFYKTPISNMTVSL